MLSSTNNARALARLDAEWPRFGQRSAPIKDRTLTRAGSCPKITRRQMCLFQLHGTPPVTPPKPDVTPATTAPATTDSSRKVSETSKSQRSLSSKGRRIRRKAAKVADAAKVAEVDMEPFDMEPWKVEVDMEPWKVHAGVDVCNYLFFSPGPAPPGLDDPGHSYLDFYEAQEKEIREEEKKEEIKKCEEDIRKHHYLLMDSDYVNADIHVAEYAPERAHLTDYQRYLTNVITREKGLALAMESILSSRSGVEARLGEYCEELKSDLRALHPDTKKHLFPKRQWEKKLRVMRSFFNQN